MNSFERFRRYGKFTVNGQDALKNKIFTNHPVCYTDNADDVSQVDHYDSDFVWLIDNSIPMSKTFPWYYKPKDDTAIHCFPYVYVGGRKVKSWDKVKLVPTKNRSGKREKQKIIAGYFDPWNGQPFFDIFFCGSTNTKAYKVLIEKYPEVKTVSSYKEASKQSTTHMFWFIPDDVEVRNSFNLKKYIPDEWSMEYTHVFGNDKIFDFDGIALFPKEYDASERELEFRFYVNKKEIKIPASKRSLYDIFDVDTYEDYLTALKNSTTELFWIKFPHANPAPDFKFDLTFKITNEYDRTNNHVFKHVVDKKETYDGIWLMSKHLPVSKKEIEHRHIVERKEWDIIASGPTLYDLFYIDTYEEYLKALDKSQTEMFWASSRNIKLNSDFNLNLFFDDRSGEFEYDRTENHAFIHRVNNQDHYNGLFLLSKHKPLSQKEIEHRHLVSRKEWNIVASGPATYDIFKVDNYEEYQVALKESKTELFWAVSSKINPLTDFKFDIYFSHDNEYDRKQNHVFKHILNDTVNYNGLFLLSKHNQVTEKEINYRNLINAKQWDIIASNAIQYDKFLIDSWNEYNTALNKSTTEMFWGISRNIDTSNFNFNLFFDDRDDEFEYERKENHAFIHRVNNQDYYNGLFLFSKNKSVSQKEIEHRHLVDVKEWDIVASGPITYDKFTVDSYEDYLRALDTSQTEMFWAISSNIDTSEFNFDVYFTHDNEYDRTTNHAFKHEVNEETLFNGVFLLTKNIK